MSPSAAEEEKAATAASKGADAGGCFIEAGLGRRLGARCVDTLLRLPLAYLMFGVVYLAYWGGVWDSNYAAAPGREGVAVAWVMGLVLVAYEPVVIALTGCTLGKLMFGIRVRQRVDPAKVPSFGQALGRWAIPVVSGITLLWLGWEVLTRVLSGSYGGRHGDVFSFLDGGRETPFAENLLAWVLLNSVLYGVVVGLPLLSGVLCLVGLRNGDGRGWHDRAACTVVVRSSVIGNESYGVPDGVSPASRWDKFSRKLNSGIMAQYEADEAARADVCRQKAKALEPDDARGDSGRA